MDHATYLLSLGRLANPIRVRALTIVGLVGARRGTSNARAALDEALDLTGDEVQERGPLLAARAEAAWLAGDEARARDEAAEGLGLAPREISPWWWSELAFWGVKAGATEPLPHPDELPFWLDATGRHREAADAWETIGAPYMRALALAESDDEADMRDGLALCNSLGARVLARRIATKLRNRGASRIARGPRTTTQSNPRRADGPPARGPRPAGVRAFEQRHRCRSRPVAQDGRSPRLGASSASWTCRIAQRRRAPLTGSGWPSAPPKMGRQRGQDREGSGPRLL